jgi:hypothetical protein
VYLGGHPDSTFLGPCIVSREGDELIIRPKQLSGDDGAYIPVRHVSIGDVIDNQGRWSVPVSQAGGICIALAAWSRASEGLDFWTRTWGYAVAGLVGAIPGTVVGLWFRARSTKVLELNVHYANQLIKVRLGVSHLRDPKANFSTILDG